MRGSRGGAWGPPGCRSEEEKRAEEERGQEGKEGERGRIKRGRMETEKRHVHRYIDG